LSPPRAEIQVFSRSIAWKISVGFTLAIGGGWRGCDGLGLKMGTVVAVTIRFAVGTEDRMIRASGRPSVRLGGVGGPEPEVVGCA